MCPLTRLLPAIRRRSCGISNKLWKVRMSIFNSISNNIPFLDLVTPHVELERELTGVFHQALHTAGFIGGPMVEEFEAEFAAFCDTKHSIAVSSGTDALRFAIMACGVQAGDVV